MIVRLIGPREGWRGGARAEEGRIVHGERGTRMTDGHRANGGQREVKGRLFAPNPD